MNRLVLAISSALVLSCAAAQSGGDRIDPRALMGTWQIMTVKDLKTGQVDSIFKRRMVWTQYTARNWTYVYMDSGRVGRTPAEFAKLSAAEKWKENYAKMWNDAGQWRFWGSGGTYWLDGNRMFYTNLVSIEPYQLQLGGMEKILYINDTAYAYESTPDKDGVVHEFTHRRLDHGGHGAGTDTTGPAAATRLIIGNWQVTSRRNQKTGETENVQQKRVNWFHVTENHWTFVWMTKDRKNVVPDDLAKLPPAQQQKERYAKIWDADGKGVFWASGGTYTIENGKFMVGGRIMSIEPYFIGVTGEEPIVKLDRDSYTYASPPDSKGEVWETSHRRIDW